MGFINLIEYEDCYQEKVKELNYEWLLRYDILEPLDTLLLDHPREMILNKGGFILLAESEGEIVGTISAIPIDSSSMELENFAVTEKMQGQKIGRMLLEKAIERAKNAGIKKLSLYTNSQLIHAIALYEKLGFAQIKQPATKFVEADMAMELTIGTIDRK
jgi:N-acetylglutamate synthase-like GNAT family acetyltransferase